MTPSTINQQQTTKKSIDLNCDLGEGGKHDAEIMPLISSCNIACGGHFGNEASIAICIELAMKNKVNIGAHSSYPDRKNFGRLPVEISLAELKKEITEQIERVLKIAKLKKGRLHHVKPHGKFYNDLMTDVEKAEILIDVILKIDPKLVLFVPPKSVVKKLAEGKLKTMTEGFADRKYEANFRLVSRQKKGAVLTQKEVIFEQVFSMVSKGKITLENGSVLNENFDTICVHSDTPNCVEILNYLNQKLPKKNIQISRK
ncbi:MAG TPA: 5-oxoprolinase subunit PxpA [Flavobacteriaceae bacterium]|nr:5-oxoprolinase subunit PxpA [Flavobacteriaceae bacterium]